jgi:hypothetical protein
MTRVLFDGGLTSISSIVLSGFIHEPNRGHLFLSLEFNNDMKENKEIRRIQKIYAYDTMPTQLPPGFSNPQSHPVFDIKFRFLVGIPPVFISPDKALEHGCLLAPKNWRSQSSYLAVNYDDQGLSIYDIGKRVFYSPIENNFKNFDQTETHAIRDWAFELLWNDKQILCLLGPDTHSDAVLIPL